MGIGNLRRSPRSVATPRRGSGDQSTVIWIWLPTATTRFSLATIPHTDVITDIHSSVTRVTSPWHHPAITTLTTRDTLLCQETETKITWNQLCFRIPTTRLLNLNSCSTRLLSLKPGTGMTNSRPFSPFGTREGISLVANFTTTTRFSPTRFYNRRGTRHPAIIMTIRCFLAQDILAPEAGNFVCGFPCRPFN